MHLTHTLYAVFPSEPVDGFYRKKQKRTPNLPCAGCGLSDLVPWRYGSVFRSRHIGEFRIRSSKKQKTTNQWRCGPTSISGSVLLCPVLFCELKPFYRSQWPFSCGSHAPFPMNLLRLICSLQNSTSFLAQTAELPSHRFLGSPPRPDEPVCVNPFTIYYSGFRFYLSSPPANFFAKFSAFFLFPQVLHSCFGQAARIFCRFLTFFTKTIPPAAPAFRTGRHSGNAAAGSGTRVLPLAA